MMTQEATLALADELESDALDHKEVAHSADCRPEDTRNWRHYLNCLAAAKALRALPPSSNEIHSSDGGVEGHAAVPLEIPTQRSGESCDPLGYGSVKVGPHREDAAGVEPCPSEAPPSSTAQEPEKWQLVPKEPTKEMIQACIWALDRWREKHGNVQGFVPPGDKYQVRWRAMLSAAPKPPSYAAPLDTPSREVLESLSMWVTTERQKYRVAGGMPAGGFGNMTPIEVALAKVENEIDRRAALPPPADTVEDISTEQMDAIEAAAIAGHPLSELPADTGQLREALEAILNTTPEERQDPSIWFKRVDAARAALQPPKSGNG